jgi:hypothetical protein
MQPYRISFDRVATGARFHQCVFVLCKRDADTMQVGGGPGMLVDGQVVPRTSAIRIQRRAMLMSLQGLHFTHTLPRLQAAAATRAALPGLAPSSAYMPHLSLLYSDISEEDR